MTIDPTTLGTEEVNARPTHAAARLLVGADSDVRIGAVPLAGTEGTGDGLSTDAERSVAQEVHIMAARRTTTTTTTPTVEAEVLTTEQAEAEQAEAKATVEAETVESTEVLTSRARTSLEITDDMLSADGLATLALSQAEGQAKFAFVVYLLGREPYNLSGKDISALTRLSEPSVSKLRLSGSLLARCGSDAHSVARQATALGQKYSRKDLGTMFDSLHGAALVSAIVAEEERLVEERKAERGVARKTAAEKQAEAEAVAAKVAAEQTPAKRIGRALDALTKVTEVPAEHARAISPLCVSVVSEAVRIAALCGVSAEAIFGHVAEIMAEAEAAADAAAVAQVA